MSSVTETRAQSVAASRSAISSRRDLGLIARHPYLAMFVLALILRVIAAVAVSAIFEGSPVLDDQTYNRMAAEYAAGQSHLWDAFTQYLFERTRALLLPISALYFLFGPHQIIGQLFVAITGSLAAVVVTRLAREIVPFRWALVAGGVIVLLPSQVLWSALILKDGPVWLILATLGLVVAIAGRSTGIKLLTTGIATALLLFVLAYLREHTVIIAAWALAMTAWAGDPHQRIHRMIGALTIAIAIPWLVGTGPAGLTLITNSGSLQEKRLAAAANADSAFVEAPEVAEAEPSQAQAGEEEAGKEPVTTTEEPPATEDGGGFDTNLSALPRGVTVMLFEPVPWGTGGSSSLKMARLESLVWYPVLILGLIGLPRLIRNRRVGLFPIVVGIGILGTYALSEGNIGTAYRHRGEFVWVIALSVACGAYMIYEVVSRRRRTRLSVSELKTN